MSKKMAKETAAMDDILAERKLAISRSFAFAFSEFWNRKWTCVAVAATYIAVSVFSTFLTTRVRVRIFAVPLALALNVVEFVMFVAWCRASIGAVRGRKPVFLDAFRISFSRLAAATATFVAYILAVAMGTVLLVLPGLVAAVTLFFALYASVDGGEWPVAAMKRSWEMTKDARFDVFMLLLITVSGNVAVYWVHWSLVLVSMPVMSFVFAHAYETLRKYGVSA